MNSKEYVRLAVQTESMDFEKIIGAVSAISNIRLLHAAMGACTEAAELVDAMKKHLFYDKPLDRVNIKEELGDILWYIAIACDEMSFDLSEVMEVNIAKLRKRYPEKFRAADALNRNLFAEREVLEHQMNYVSEVKLLPEPSCGVCGAILTPNGWVCKSCGFVIVQEG